MDGLRRMSSAVIAIMWCPSAAVVKPNCSGKLCAFGATWIGSDKSTLISCTDNLITLTFGVRPFKTTKKTEAGKFYFVGPLEKNLPSRVLGGIIIHLREQAVASHRKWTVLMIAQKLGWKQESQQLKPGFVVSPTDVCIFIQHLSEGSHCIVHQRQHFPQRTKLPISNFYL